MDYVSSEWFSKRAEQCHDVVKFLASVTRWKQCIPSVVKKTKKTSKTVLISTQLESAITLNFLG